MVERGREEGLSERSEGRPSYDRLSLLTRAYALAFLSGAGVDAVDAACGVGAL